MMPGRVERRLGELEARLRPPAPLLAGPPA